MSAFATDAAAPLTLSEQLDAMLTGWLERRADSGTSGRLGSRAKAVMTVAESALAEVEKFCRGWSMTVERPARGNLALIEGPALPVEGFAAIAVMYRR
jgi:hypothetical protein